MVALVTENKDSLSTFMMGVKRLVVKDIPIITILIGVSQFQLSDYHKEPFALS